MKFLLLSLVLCALATASTAQSSTMQMQMTIGKMLTLVRDLSVANIALAENTEDQLALTSLYTTSEELYTLLQVFNSSNIAALPLDSRTKLSNALTSFRNALFAWESAMDQRLPDEMTRTFKDVENAFLNFGGVVFSL
uniref:Uncharacterized protein n=1 Tax=Anopheles epiroticus TaxID=199890 RepID=A0A182PPN6_9DIPT